jgi:hypothetical protein
MHIYKIHIYKRPIAIGSKRKTRGSFIQPRQGEYFNIASGSVEKKPRGRYNPASGYFEEE